MRTSITSVFAIAFCLFLSINVSAQDRFTLNRDSTTKIIKDPRYDQKPLKCLYVLDDKQYYRRSIKKSWQLDTSNILDIKVLKGTESRSRYGKSGRNGAIIITTKKYAIAQYQKKFSLFSRKYKDYLEHHQDDDDSVNYIVNGIFLRVKSAHPMEDLYELSVDKIRTVDFIENQFYNGGDSRPYMAIITTKR